MECKMNYINAIFASRWFFSLIMKLLKGSLKAVPLVATMHCIGEA